MQRALLRLFLALFALLQGVSPLLHAHVMPPAGGQTGLHVHAVAIAPARERGQATSLTFAAQPDSAAITAPTEHRRDELLSHLTQPGPARTQPVRALTAAAADAHSRAAGVQARILALRLPPAQGPPTATSFA
jgi:hypothetical protein